ncbi:endo-1,4-beta-xylanase [Actinoplanes couchii]|uniref:Beta-xylanase n=1 Tax=Actinoplanes couchii TaxID=403638 RepID=A0ABQ3XQR0_9ACTN|nr:endo-1,4-beta-xylanase [Actinoplanes couchii]MDR6318806.1 endo-1,4-beta-xylanase [Actinoplanes couchii]GID60837.1 beta-xylanase [Actinoplanes couchii]
MPNVFRARLALFVSGLCLLAGGAACDPSGDRDTRPTASGTAPASGRVDLLAGDWSHLPGGTVGSGGVRIHGLGRQIVEQDGTGGQPHPPVNLRGPQLTVHGDFQVSATLHRPAGQIASLYLYGEVPIVYDEWLQNRRGLRVTVSDRDLKLTVWDGRSAAPVADRTAPITSPATITVTFERHGGVLMLSTGDTRVSVPDPGVFDAGSVTFGVDAVPGAPDWTLAALDADGVAVRDTPLAGQSSQSPDSLRVLADTTGRRLPIGAAMAAEPLISDDGYRTLAATQFSMLTTENALKPQFVHPGPDTYDFTEGDLLADFAAANDMRVHAHTLVFGEANPRWMQQVALADRERVMTEHIRTVAGHYRGRVAEWDVVNEPLSPDDDGPDGRPGLREHLWQEAMGESYIDKAFIAARAADPEAKLYLNEFGAEADGPRWDALYDLVVRLQERGVPIDGVGFQSHIHEAGDHVDPAVLRSHIADLAELGLSARISEIDVYGESPSVQAGQFAGVLGACLSEPTCTSFSIWGITDRYGSTAEHDSYPLETGDELPWDQQLRPKPAVAALRDTLRAARR